MEDIGNEDILSANPTEDQFINSLNLDKDVERRLSLLMSSTRKGSSIVLMTPVGRDNTPERVLSEWDKVFLANSSVINDTLLNLEQEQRGKYGPMSIAKPWSERIKSFQETYQPEEIDNSILSKIQNLATNRNFLRPISLSNANKLLQNTTNSGLPYFTKKGIVKDKVLQKFDELLDRKDPCILFTRTQEQKKTRNVWGFPIADTLNEMRYYAPLLEHQKKLSYRSAIVSPAEVDRRVSQLFEIKRNAGRKLLSVDFSAFDSTVKSSIQKKCFNYIKSLFQSNCLEDLNYIEERFNTIGIVTPSGVYRGKHGVPSGSTFTNEVDSIAQVSIAQSHPYIATTDMQIQGDDGLYAIPEDKYSEFIQGFKAQGLIVNDEKSHFEEKWCTYLQCLYHEDYSSNGFIGGIYPIYRALNRLVYQERWANFEDYGISGRDYYSIRAICIVENCKYHPLFRKFVEFVFRLDKYSLSPTDEGINSYVQMIIKTQSGGGILQHQYGTNVKGIRNFETFKILKELS